MQDKEGSKAMTFYILICFLLAGAAGVGYKLKMDQRDELTGDYADLYAKNQKIAGEFAPNIRDYYSLLDREVIKPINAETKARTPEELLAVAAELKLRDTQGGDDQLDIQTTPRANPKKDYTEYTMEVKLKNVTMGQWEAFITETENRVFKYAWITDLNVLRVEAKYEKISELEQPGSDPSLWTVSFTLRWFGPAKPTRTA